MEASEHTVSYSKRVYRCDHCNGVLYECHIGEGGCPRCGGRRVRIAVGISAEELTFLQKEGYEYDADDWMDEAQAIEKQRMEREIR